jgi:hypothetical protein
VAPMVAQATTLPEADYLNRHLAVIAWRLLGNSA